MSGRLERALEECGVDLRADERVAVLAVAGEILGLRAPGSDSPVPPSSRPASPDRFVRAAPGDPYGAVLRWCDAAPLGDGPLAGRTLSVKDSIAVAGVPMTCGLPGLAENIPTRDSAVVVRLRRAGARVVAVTNMDALGMAASGETSGYGVTRNPHDPVRTAGGSSAGAAAGLLSPAIDLALGTDQGGSIRVPASWCGVLGLKPTHDLVPYAGNAGIHPTLDHVGPLARTAADLATMMEVLTGGTVPATGEPGRLAGLRVGVLTEAIRATLPEMTEIVEATAGRLAELGAEIRRVSVPEHLEAGAPSGLVNSLGIADMLAAGGPAGPGGPALDRRVRTLAADQPALLSPQVKAAWIAGTALRRDRRAVEAQVGAARRRLRAAYDRALSIVDLLIMPTAPRPAFVVPADDSPEGLLRRGWEPLVGTEPFNLSGHPALSMPTGLVTDGDAVLPAGTMLVGRHGEDARLVAVATCYERAFGWAAP